MIEVDRLTKRFELTLAAVLLVGHTEARFRAAAIASRKICCRAPQAPRS
jgi:hypothetical protein